MSEGGDFETAGLSGASEQKEINMEQVQEEARRSQAAIKQLQKEEGHAKAQDSNLAAIIVQFLNQPQNTDLFLLISRIVAQNIPSELIVAVISLIHAQAATEVAFYLTAGETEAPAERALIANEKATFTNLPQEHKAAVDAWIKRIDQVAAKKPHRILETIIIKGPQQEISPVLIQFSAFILRNYLKQHSIAFEYEDLRDFMQAVFVEIIKNLESLVAGQKQLEGTE